MAGLERLKGIVGQLKTTLTGIDLSGKAASNMVSLEETLANGVKEGKVPHVVVFATNTDGTFKYKHAVGKSHYPDEEPIKEDAVFLLASQTKLLTTIAALQIVDKGLFGLDDDVSEKLPELGGQKIIEGFGEDDKPILVDRKNAITLRHLLTHSAGSTYDSAHPLLIKLRQQQGHGPNTGTTVHERFAYPLIYDPGTSWSYSASIDWAGKLVERLTDSTLEEYMQKNMWEPLGIKNISFWPYENPELKDKVPGLTTRTPEGKLVPFNEPFLNTGSKDCFGGHGAYAAMGDFLKVQHSILANDGKLLKPQTVDLMFQPQLSPESAEALEKFMKHSPMAAMIIGEFNPDVECNWGLGGILFMQDDVGKRKKGTLSWGGMSNPFWLIDREAGLALTFGTQVLPPGDKPTEEMISAVELAVYEKAGVKL
ncbi:hypothetical protein LTR36_009790 [Oleoguttula mirabilis]|uniref:Beta-lactamase-related domain-containing protein n=1 Tax=Oleoguttula mirabilis TaxID=1507867 RepID=A0AAV9J555_9PEZI|nr:hypothetical protein LTR36_009790 [Oleoguttula mirabilis]